MQNNRYQNSTFRIHNAISQKRAFLLNLEAASFHFQHSEVSLFPKITISDSVIECNTVIVRGLTARRNFRTLSEAISRTTDPYRVSKSIYIQSQSDHLFCHLKEQTFKAIIRVEKFSFFLNQSKSNVFSNKRKGFMVTTRPGSHFPKFTLPHRVE